MSFLCEHRAISSGRWKVECQKLKVKSQKNFTFVMTRRIWLMSAHHGSMLCHAHDKTCGSYHRSWLSICHATTKIVCDNGTQIWYSNVHTWPLSHLLYIPDLWLICCAYLTVSWLVVHTWPLSNWLCIPDCCLIVCAYLTVVWLVVHTWLLPDWLCIPDLSLIVWQCAYLTFVWLVGNVHTWPLSDWLTMCIPDLCLIGHTW